MSIIVDYLLRRPAGDTPPLVLQRVITIPLGISLEIKAYRGPIVDVLVSPPISNFGHHPWIR